MLHNGLYEQIINKGLDTELSVTDKLSQTAPIDSAEASKVLAKYVAEIVENGLNNVKDNGGNLTSQVELVNRIMSTIMTETKEADFDMLSVAERAEQLLALFDKKNNVLALDERAEIIRPETSIAQSSLFTGAVHEPQMFTELKKRNRLGRSDRYAGVLHQMERPAAHHGRAAGIHAKRRRAPHHHHLLHGRYRRESH